MTPEERLEKIAVDYRNGTIPGAAQVAQDVAFMMEMIHRLHEALHAAHGVPIKK